MWKKENQDINGFFKLTRNASIEKVLAATLDDGLEITGTDQHPNLNSTQNSYKKYKNFMNSKLTSWPKTNPNLKKAHQVTHIIQ